MIHSSQRALKRYEVRAGVDVFMSTHGKVGNGDILSRELFDILFPFVPFEGGHIKRHQFGREPREWVVDTELIVATHCDRLFVVFSRFWPLVGHHEGTCGIPDCESGLWITASHDLVVIILNNVWDKNLWGQHWPEKRHKETSVDWPVGRNIPLCRHQCVSWIRKRHPTGHRSRSRSFLMMSFWFRNIILTVWRWSSCRPLIWSWLLMD